MLSGFHVGSSGVTICPSVFRGTVSASLLAFVGRCQVFNASSSPIRVLLTRAVLDLRLIVKGAHVIFADGSLYHPTKTLIPKPKTLNLKSKRDSPNQALVLQGLGVSSPAASSCRFGLGMGYRAEGI